MSNRESATIRISDDGSWTLDAPVPFTGPCASLKAADALVAGEIDRVPAHLDEDTVLRLANRVRDMAHCRRMRELLADEIFAA